MSESIFNGQLHLANGVAQSAAVTAALDGNEVAKRTVGEFLHYKGDKPQAAAGDTGLRYLRMAMNNSKDMVLVGASAVLAESWFGKNSPAYVLLLAVLSDFALNGPKQRDRRCVSTVLDQALGHANAFEIAFVDGRKLVLTRESQGGVSVLEYRHGLRTAMAGPTGVTIKLTRAEDGQITSFTLPGGPTYRRQPDKCGKYGDLWQCGIDGSISWQIAGPKCYSNGSVVIADKDFEYTWKRDCTLEKQLSEHKLKNGARLRFSRGKLAQLFYADTSTTNPVILRTVEWADGAVSHMVTYRKAGLPTAITRQLNQAGHYTNEYTFALPVYNQRLEQWTYQSKTKSGKLEVSSDGHYSWTGDDGYREAQDMEGPLYIWRDGSDVYSE